MAYVAGGTGLFITAYHAPMADLFPQRYARTQRFTLGQPRDLLVAPDGARVTFLRSNAGDDPVTRLWVLDVPTGEERMVADPVRLLGEDEGGEAAAEERARRERARERARGIVACATDRDVRTAVFSVSGRLFVAGLEPGEEPREIPVAGPVFDPRLDPEGQRVGFLCERSLCVSDLEGRSVVVASEDDENVSWGAAEFIAAEEMGRSRGFWWSPDGSSMAACRVDVSSVERRYIADPANPDLPPVEVRYPAAGTANADVTLHVLRLDGGPRVDVDWDRSAFEYLAAVEWPADGPLLAVVQSRDQRRVRVLRVDDNDGRTDTILDDLDDRWVELVPGTPRWLEGGHLVTCADRGGARRLLMDGDPVTPPRLQVRAVVGTQEAGVVFLANELAEPTELHVWRWSQVGGSERLTDESGVHAAEIGGVTVVVRSASMDRDGSVTRVLGGPTIASVAESPAVRPNVTLLRGGERALATAVLLPDGADPSVKLPVLLDPYGGPHFQRVTKSRSQFLVSQWFADQGFAVVVCDGRGTPGRGSEWERAIHLDVAGPVLEDQVDALHAAADRFPHMDLDRVAIRGWSFGGELAAFAVMRRPDVFHAAIAGAPVTDQRLYDTHYTERYLGLPASNPDVYDRNSVIPDAEKLERPLLLIHGLVDDNVLVANTLQLSSALLAVGRMHRVLPLSGATHMAAGAIEENLLSLELTFLREALGLEDND